MTGKFNLTNEKIKANIEHLQAYLVQKNLDGIYISSYDEFINEYVPMSDCHRYFYTRFSGSTACLLYTSPSPRD